MAGLLEADTGNRRFTNAAGEVAAITRIGFMLQRPVLLRRSLTANLCFAMDAAGIAGDEQQERAEAVLAKMGLAEKVNCRHYNYRKGNANGWHWRG